MVEHYQADTTIMTKELHEQGWATHLQEAQPTNNGGTSTGVGFAVRKYLCCQQLLKTENKRWIAIHLRFQQRTIVMIVAYFQPGGLPQDSNVELTDEIVAYVRMLKTEYIIMADWNAQPQEVAETGLARKLQGQILHRGPTINTGSTLDYYLVSSQLVGVAFLTVVHEVPFKPHYAVALELKSEFMQKPAPQLLQV